MMDYDCRSSEKRLAAVENDWLAAPENAELLEVYTCSLCGNPIIWLWTAAAKYAANVWKG